MNMVEIIASITGSHLLAEYVTTDECLRTMITALSESPTAWKINKGIIASSSAVPASQMERTFRIRLSHIPQSTTPEVLRLTTATQQLIDYCSSNPTSGITGVIFNCSSYSYSVATGARDTRERQEPSRRRVYSNRPLPAAASLSLGRQWAATASCNG